MHLKLVIAMFLEATRRVRPSSRSRMRLSTQEFELLADFSAMYATVLADARQLDSFTREKEENIMRAFYQKRHGCNVFGLSG